MSIGYQALIGLLPTNESSKSKIRIKIPSIGKIEPICQCNQMSCLICSRKRSASMLSLKPLKRSLIIDTNQQLQLDMQPKQLNVLSKNVSRQVSNHIIHNSAYTGKANQHSKINIISQPWLLSKSNSRKISIEKISQLQRSSSQSILINKEIGRFSFRFLYIIGKGGFGKVWRVEMKQSKNEYALKEMLKSKVINKRSVTSVMNEKYLLENLNHPFIVNMHYAFQDKEYLYLVLDLLRGGDLRYHIGKNKKFSEEQTKFFICNIILALEYLHQNGIIHRDVKPENLVFDKDGYLRLTDLGVARLNTTHISNDTSGTPGYMAPEVILRQDHSYPVDFFALGVITYELLLGKRPYNGNNRQEIREQIIAKQVYIKENTVGISKQAIDFVNKLLIRKPQSRLGNNGIEQITNHPWVKGFPWSKLINKELKSLYIPGNIDGNTEFQNQISIDSELEEGCDTLLRRKSVQQLFEGYRHQ